MVESNHALTLLYKMEYNEMEKSARETRFKWSFNLKNEDKARFHYSTLTINIWMNMKKKNMKMEKVKKERKKKKICKFNCSTAQKKQPTH